MTPDQRRRRQGRPEGAEAAIGLMTVVNTVGADGEGITVAGKAYVFQDALTNVDGNIRVGATLAEFRRNIFAAINLDPEGAGTQYAAAMTVNPNAKAAPKSRLVEGPDPLTIPITAKIPGAAGNSLNLLTSDGTVVSVSGATLTGGDDTELAISPLTPTVDANAEAATGVLRFHSISALDGETIDIGGKTYTFDASLADVDGHVFIETDVPTTLANILAAIALGAGAGSKYANSMTLHPSVSGVVGGFIDAVGILTLTGSPAQTNSVTIDGKVYTFRVNIDLAAVGILTLTGNALNNETVTIDGKVYTFQDSLTNVDGNVQIAGTAAGSLDNLIAAITLGSGAGTFYAALTTLHPTVTAAAGAGDTLDATAKVPGIGGNTIATLEGLTNGGWDAAVLEDGEGAADGDVLVALPSAAIDNLIAAITLGAGAGTAYAAATTLHPTVTAVAGAGDTMDATAKTPGSAGNLIATLSDLTAGSWATPTLASGADNGDLTAKTPGAAGNSIVQLTSNNNLISFDDTSMSGGADAGVAGQQMTQVRTLFAKNVSERGGFPTWKSDDENVFAVSQPDDADGDGVVEDAGGFITGVSDGVADVSAEFPGVIPVATEVTLT